MTPKRKILECHNNDKQGSGLMLILTKDEYDTMHVMCYTERDNGYTETYPFPADHPNSALYEAFERTFVACNYMTIEDVHEMVKFWRSDGDPEIV